MIATVHKLAPRRVNQTVRTLSRIPNAEMRPAGEDLYPSRFAASSRPPGLTITAPATPS